MAKYADVAFTSFARLEDIHSGIRELRELARGEFGREIQIWTSGGVVMCAPTEKEARQLSRYFLVEKMDLDAAVDWDRQQGFLEPSIPPSAADQRTREKRLRVADTAPLVGTPEQIVAHLQRLSDAGVDGCALTWMDYVTGIRQWNQEVMPLLEQAGLRKPIPMTAPT